MKNSYNRRSFIGKLSTASAGVTLLSSVSLNALSNNRNLLDAQKGEISSKANLRIASFGNQVVTVYGKVYRQDGVSVSSNTIVEMWHLSPNSNSLGHRAKVTTDHNGEFILVTDFPNRASGKMPAIHFKLENTDKIYELQMWTRGVGDGRGGWS